jgi:phage shock protein C
MYRSNSNKVIAGVCGGMGEYFDVDPTLLRLITVVGALASGGFLILAYVLAWIILPLPFPGQPVSEPSVIAPFPPRPRGRWGTYLPGLILVAIGGLLLLREYVYWFSFRDLWPILLVLLGMILILRNGRTSEPARTPGEPPPPNVPDPNRDDGGPRA